MIITRTLRVRGDSLRLFIEGLFLRKKSGDKSPHPKQDSQCKHWLFGFLTFVKA